MATTKIRRIQDSVHGLMEFRGMEASAIELLRTPELQRLRKIRQLGLSHLVFPGAEHSRLVHSIGSSYLAVRFGRQLQEVAGEHLVPELCPTEESIRDLAIAALCHDLGHGPLSHAWEHVVIGERYDISAWKKSLGLSVDDPLVPSSLKWHELVGHALLAWECGTLHRLMEQQEEGLSKRIRQMLSGTYYLPYLPRLLSSDIDVDRADFIRRDTHQTGVAYGRYDLDWLISTCNVAEVQYPREVQLVVGFDGRKSIRVLEQFLIARRSLYETVYQHKTVRCAEGMVSVFLNRLKDETILGRSPTVASFVEPTLKMIQGQPIGLDEILKLDDFALSVLIDSFAQATTPSIDTVARDLAQRIISRDLFKMVPIETEPLNEFFRAPNSYERLYDVIKPFVPGDSNYYVWVDSSKFSMLSDDPNNQAYVILNDKTVSANEHDILRVYKGTSNETIRIFTVRQAVPSVLKLINGR